MLDLISIEYIKLKNNSSFWVIIILYILISFYIVGKADSLPSGSDVFANPLQFPMVWLTSTYCASFFILFPSILIILNIGNEFKYRTAKQHVIDGLSKTTFVLSKFISVWLIATIITVYILLLSLFLGWQSGGESSDFFGEQFSFIAGFYIQLIGVLSFAFLIAITFKRTGISIIVFIGYYFIEVILYWLVFKDSLVRDYLPLEVFNNLTFSPIKDNFDDFNGLSIPEFNLSLNWFSAAIGTVYIAICLSLSILIFNKRDV
jgi:ABC-type transport system involved in multi-copper enzyme maturation permease subunit